MKEYTTSLALKSSLLVEPFISDKEKESFLNNLQVMTQTCEPSL